jgi:hypothetical protein
MSKRAKKNKSNKELLLSFFSAPAAQGSYCTPDVCFANTAPFSSTSLIPPSNVPVNAKHQTYLPPPEHSSILAKFSSLIPKELMELITQAAKQGLLLSMLITLVNEGATDLLKKLHFHPNRIYLVNQAIRAFLMLALSNSPSMTIAVPVGSYVLSKYCKMSIEEANSFTTGLAAATYIMVSESSPLSTTVGFMTSIGASILGSRIAQTSYRYLSTVFFSKDESSDNETGNKWNSRCS